LVGACGRLASTPEVSILGKRYSVLSTSFLKRDTISEYRSLEGVLTSLSNHSNWYAMKRTLLDSTLPWMRLGVSNRMTRESFMCMFRDMKGASTAVAIAHVEVLILRHEPAAVARSEALPFFFHHRISLSWLAGLEREVVLVLCCNGLRGICPVGRSMIRRTTSEHYLIRRFNRCLGASIAECQQERVAKTLLS
jgi:hypothetical protein